MSTTEAPPEHKHKHKHKHHGEAAAVTSEAAAVVQSAAAVSASGAVSSSTSTTSAATATATAEKKDNAPLVARSTFDGDQQQLQRLGDIGRIYPQDFEVPATLKLTLEDAQIINAANVAEVCIEIIRNVPRPPSLSLEGAGAIAAYTFDFGGGGNPEDNPYFRLNRALYQRNLLQLRRFRGFIYLLLWALRQLPRFYPPKKTLFRGITKKVPLDDAHYKAGNKVTWHTACSTSLDMQVTKNFITDRTTGVCSGTLFVITGDCWGYDIAPFSCIPSEREILLEPETDFMITGIVDSTSLIVVNLEMVESKALLGDIIKSAVTVSSPPVATPVTPPQAATPIRPPTVNPQPSQSPPASTPSPSPTPTPSTPLQMATPATTLSQTTQPSTLPPENAPLVEKKHKHHHHKKPTDATPL